MFEEPFIIIQAGQDLLGCCDSRPWECLKERELFLSKDFKCIRDYLDASCPEKPSLMLRKSLLSHGLQRLARGLGSSARI